MVVEQRYEIGSAGLFPIFIPMSGGKGPLLDLMLRLSGQEWNEPGENLAPYYERLLSRAERQIQMVSTDLGSRSQLIEQGKLPFILAEKLHQGVQLEYAFNKKGVSTAAEAETAINQDNPALVVLKTRFPNLVRFFWLQGQPTMDFTVVDAKHILIECVKPVRVENPAIMIKNDSGLAGILNSRFYQTTRDYCEELLK